MYEFTADTVVSEALGLDDRVVGVFRRLGLRCWPQGDADWCVASEGETLADVARYHEMDLARLLAELDALRIPGSGKA